jgi:hypothetical protein
MEEVRSNELRATLEDLMYVSILEKFLLLGVDMLPRMDGKQTLLPFLSPFLGGGGEGGGLGIAAVWFKIREHHPHHPH